MFGHWEIIIILLVAILVFGATRIPTVGRGLGEGLRNFKDALRGKADDEKETKLETTASKDQTEDQEEEKKA